MDDKMANVLAAAKKAFDKQPAIDVAALLDGDLNVAWGSVTSSVEQTQLLLVQILRNQQRDKRE